MLKAACISLMVALTVTPALARTFVYEGKTFTYTVEQRGDAKILVGQFDGTRPFRLRVARGYVTGTVDGHRVSFAERHALRANIIVSGDALARR